MNLAAVLLVGGAIAMSACSDSTGPTGGRPQVVTPIYPLAYVAERIGGDLIEVTDLTPAGVEPHDVELTPQQVVTLARADLTLFIGGGFQPSVEEALGSVQGQVLDALEVVGPDLIEGDPHLWLDPTLLAEVGDAVANALGDVDPEHEEAFTRSASELRAELEELNTSYSRLLGNCERTEMVTAHDAFGYLAKRYGLEPLAIAGVDPASEPSAGRLAEISQLAKTRGVTTIFTESLVSPRVAETVAAEAGVKTAVLDPLESEPAGRDYIGAMEENLEVLSEALGCRR